MSCKWMRRPSCASNRSIAPLPKLPVRDAEVGKVDVSKMKISSEYRPFRIEATLTVCASSSLAQIKIMFSVNPPSVLIRPIRAQDERSLRSGSRVSILPLEALRITLRVELRVVTLGVVFRIRILGVIALRIVFRIRVLGIVALRVILGIVLRIVGLRIIFGIALGIEFRVWPLRVRELRVSILRVKLRIALRVELRVGLFGVNLFGVIERTRIVLSKLFNRPWAGVSLRLKSLRLETFRLKVLWLETLRFKLLRFEVLRFEVFWFELFWLELLWLKLLGVESLRLQTLRVEFRIAYLRVELLRVKLLWIEALRLKLFGVSPLRIELLGV